MTAGFSDSTAYSVSLLLPLDLEASLAEWASRTEGATLDPLASHVTLLMFHSEADPHAIAELLRQPFSAFPPFVLQLDDIVQEPYWGKENLDIVMLAGTSEALGVQRVKELREHLVAALEPVLAGEPEVPDHEYLPHLTLTTGLPPDKARLLAQAAQGLSVSFEVREVWLRQESNGGLWHPVASLALSA